MSERRDESRILTGYGAVSAQGCEPVPVRYRVRISLGPEGRAVRGTLIGRHAGLRPIWLEPDAVLRLRDGRRLAIAVTDLVGDAAEFEGVRPPPSS